jgi:hypothetical protein
MDCSKEQALSTLESWKSSGSRIHCVFLPKISKFYFTVPSKVALVDETKLILSSNTEKDFEFYISLENVAFTFSDPRELKPESREHFKEKYEATLSIILPTKDWLLLGAYKNKGLN